MSHSRRCTVCWKAPKHSVDVSFIINNLRKSTEVPVSDLKMR
jgi:hypothetical protein